MSIRPSSIQNFAKAVSRIAGLEFAGEEELAADQFDENPEFYLLVPQLDALREIVSLWQRWQLIGTVPRNYTPWRDLFAQLRSFRPGERQIGSPRRTATTSATLSTGHPITTPFASRSNWWGGQGGILACRRSRCHQPCRPKRWRGHRPLSPTRICLSRSLGGRPHGRDPTKY